jgi:phosphatidylserine/phosphatidylglycerophosphate/cardiolipin synthase-like enzyme
MDKPVEAEVKAALTIADLEAHKASPTTAGYPEFVRTFYSPQDEVHEVLKAIIGSARRSIVVAMFGYDDDELAEMLAKALTDPHMHVQITLDKSQAGGVHERAILEKYRHEMSGNSVAIGTSEHSAIMHRKMVIVDGVWRISGSTNWSTSGESLQDNEMTVIYDAAVCAEARPVLDVEHDHALAQMAKAASAPTRPTGRTAA